MNETILRAENLKAFYVLDMHGTQKMVKAVNEVDLEVRENEVYGIAGESGCGKTTLLKALFGAIEPPLRLMGGKIYYCANGEEMDVTSLSAEEKRKLRWEYISYVPQGSMSVLNPVLKLKETYQDFLASHVGGKTREQAFELAKGHIAELGLPRNVLETYPHQLSGGMRQRVTIALATILKPRIIICDEPTTALDVVVQRGVVQLLTGYSSKTGKHDHPGNARHGRSCQYRRSDRHHVCRQDGRRGDHRKDLRRTVSPLHTVLDQLAAEIWRQIRPGDRAGQSAFSLKPPQRMLLPPPVSSRAWTFARNRYLASPTWQPTTRSPAGWPEMENMTKLLDVDHLSKVFTLGSILSRERITAVDNVSFDINPAEIVALAGESGCGKTTTARIVLGFEEATSGTITHNGKKQTRGQKVWFTEGVQAIFQDPFSTFNPLRTVDRYFFETVQNYRLARGRKEAIEWIDRKLKAVGLSYEEFAGRYPNEFSGGQLQRVSIARALLTDPTLLIADEPVSMVDASLRMSIVNLFKKLKEELGVSVLYITHDLATAYYVSDRIAIMFRGNIVEMGPVEQVLMKPKTSIHKTAQGVYP